MVLHLPRVRRKKTIQKRKWKYKTTIALKTDNPTKQRSAMLNVALNDSKPTSDNACHWMHRFPFVWRAGTTQNETKWRFNWALSIWNASDGAEASPLLPTRKKDSTWRTLNPQRRRGAKCLCREVKANVWKDDGRRAKGASSSPTEEGNKIHPLMVFFF